MSAGSGETLTDTFSDRGGDDLAGDLPDDLRARVKRELDPGERLLWAAASSPPPSASGDGYFIAVMVELLMLLTGVGFVILAKLGPTAYGARESPLVLGVIFCMIAGFALIATVAAWFGARRQRRQQSTPFYAVTDQRAIQWQPEHGSDAVRIIFLRRGTIHHLVRIERPDGSGSLEFYRRSQAGHFPSWRAFQHIPDVRRVEQIVRNNLMKEIDENTG
jgi:hypothetical protein